MYKSDYTNWVLGRDFNTPPPRPRSLSALKYSLPTNSSVQGRRQTFISSCLLALMAPCCCSPVFKSSCVTGRILNVEEFMVAFMAKSTLKHLSWVTGIFLISNVVVLVLGVLCNYPEPW